ncbi:MAG: cytidine deaminase [Clostridia bacterium]|nr:cytidine deaminase [Clostridia bacterium]
MKLEWTMSLPVEPGLLSLMQIAADQAARAEGLALPCGAAVRFCGDEEIRTLNAQYRGVDRATDVLSFPAIGWRKGITAGKDPARLKRHFDPEEGCCFLGDVVISLDHLRDQARQFGHSEAREAAYLLVHSLCHLMGYDHMEEEEKTVMREKEEEILSAVGVTREGKAAVSDETLLALARDAMTRSYSPYSHYPVGAALLAADGRVFQGCNIENASFGATICAERTAMVKAVSEGARQFETIAIATRDTPGWPCGICRQFMSEFSPDIRVLVTWGDGKYIEEGRLSTLLPHQFELKE